MNLRFIDWVWHIRGSLALAPEQSSDHAFLQLAPLFRQPDTTTERTDDTLTFHKKNQAAQDKMAIYDSGVLQIAGGATGSVLRYDLTSRVLLFCFLAPLLFLGFAQITILVGKYQATTEAVDKAGKAAEAKKKAAKKDAVLPQNPIDKFLGAPEPKKPGKNGKGDSDEDKKPSPIAAYVFAGIFATLYAVGRILEDWLIKRLFRRSLLGSGQMRSIAASGGAATLSTPSDCQC